MIMIIKMIEIYNIAAHAALLLVVNPAYYIETIAPRTPLTYLSSKRRRFVTSYVQPVIQQYESTTVTFVIKVATTDDFRNNHHVQSTLFMVNKDEWDTKEGRGKSMKNALHAGTVVLQKAPLGLKWRWTAKKSSPYP